MGPESKDVVDISQPHGRTRGDGREDLRLKEFHVQVSQNRGERRAHGNTECLHQRPEQSGFTPGKSTIDCILALQVMVERRREFGRGLLAAYIDLKKAFDSVQRESWEILTQRNSNMDFWINSKSTYWSGARLCPCANTFQHLHGLDNGQSYFPKSVEQHWTILDIALGLQVSWTKTKIQDFGGLLGEPVQLIRACGEDVEVMENFTYLGSAVHVSGLSDQEVSRRIGLAVGTMNSVKKSIWRCRYLCRRTNLRVFQNFIMPYRHLARFPVDDPAHQVVFV
ncbi:uncharacterized protein [Penaeus vannamei]|uniref:uncharacterized protein n=1 Tax=Penaeus vannamei TaxID=6689 RepID=UPI00387F933D